MIPSIRLATSRLGSQCARCLTTGSAADKKTLDEALLALGSSLPDIPKAVETATTMPLPRPASSTPPKFMNIPPAEDPLLEYIASSLTKHGHRARASRITSRMLLHLHAFTRAEPVPIVREAIRLASPAVKCLIHRKSAKNVVKPVALGEKQRVRFAFQWILKASETKPASTIEERLAREMIAVLQGSSSVLKQKEDVHRFAMVNRGNVLRR